MIEIPKRNSLVSQTVASLRQGLQSGLWQDHLPGERALCERLLVSRPTLRAALEVLEGEGVIEVGHGKHRKILKGSQAPAGRENQLVVVVSREPLHQMTPATVFYLNELRAHLQETGYQMEICTGVELGGRHPERVLADQLKGKRRVVCWILFLAGEKLQQWFSDSKLPALVVGSCYAGVRLASLDVDYTAVCRHAVGVFVRHGHRRIAMIAPERPRAGDEASESGFLEGIAQMKHEGVTGVVMRHDTTVEGLRRRLDVLLKGKEPPTALLVSRPLHVLTVLTHLLRRGIAVPGQVSLISRDYDLFLDQCVPAIARYVFRRRDFAKRLSRLVMQMAATGSLPRRQERVMPRFEKQESVALPAMEKS